MTDKTGHTAFHLNAPEGERFEALSELTKSHASVEQPLLAAAQFFAEHEKIAAMTDLVHRQMLEADFAKAATPISMSPNDVRGSLRGADYGMQSLQIDPLRVQTQGDYYEKSGPIDFSTMEEMVRQTPMLSAIVLTRCRQVSRFCKVSQQADLPGFTIATADPSVEIDPVEKESITALAGFFSNCGWESNPWQRKRLRRDNFSQFMTKFIRNTLIFDAAPVEVEYRKDRRLGLAGFYAVDGASIRLCINGYQGDPDIYAVQVVDGMVRTTYTFEDLIYEARNPSASIAAAGYGMSETELLIKVVTGILNAMQLNISGFTDNTIPRGVLNLFGQYKQEDINQFKQYWASMTRGTKNYWGMPILVGQDGQTGAKFERFGVDFNEMYFSKWMTFLTSVACAIYGIAPDEINFESFTSGSSSLGRSNDTSDKLASSKDKGLMPLLRYAEATMSDYLCASFGEKYVFQWTGLEDEDLEKRHELRKSVLTVNEIRAQEGYDKIREGWGDAPLNPSLQGVWQQSQQPQGQQQSEEPTPAEALDQGGEEEEEPAEEEPDTDPDGLRKGWQTQANPITFIPGW